MLGRIAGGIGGLIAIAGAAWFIYYLGKVQGRTECALANSEKAASQAVSFAEQSNQSEVQKQTEIRTYEKEVKVKFVDRWNTIKEQPIYTDRQFGLPADGVRLLQARVQAANAAVASSFGIAPATFGDAPTDPDADGVIVWADINTWAFGVIDTWVNCELNRSAAKNAWPKSEQK